MTCRRPKKDINYQIGTNILQQSKWVKAEAAAEAAAAEAEAEEAAAEGRRRSGSSHVILR
jgi:hypothetical protein